MTSATTPREGHLPLINKGKPSEGLFLFASYRHWFTSPRLGLAIGRHGLTKAQRETLADPNIPAKSTGGDHHKPIGRRSPTPHRSRPSTQPWPSPDLFVAVCAPKWAFPGSLFPSGICYAVAVFTTSSRFVMSSRYALALGHRNHGPQRSPADQLCRDCPASTAFPGGRES
jgi:hypothetical protein